MAALPPWKQALLDRKKKQEQEEEAKKIQAEEAKLATLPPWKRAILLREKQGKEGGTSSALASSQSQASGKKGPLSNKWQVAVERVKGPDSPILKKKPLSAGPTVTERWKPKDSPSSQNVSIRTTTPQATKANEGKNLSGLPAQKQALQTKDKQMRVSSTPASDEDVPAWKRALAKKEKKTTISLTASIPASSVEIPAWKQALEKKTTISSTTRPDDKLPAWKQTPGKKTTVSSTTPTPGPDDKVPAWKPTPGKKTAVSSTTSTGKDDANLSKIPAWKRALILKKQGRSIDGMEASSQRIVGEDESDSAELTVNIPTKTVEQQPVVMNRNEEENEVTSQRLVEQEGITLHPPVYKEVDEWANVKEEDEKFKDLPLWKQALIKRRRADIAKRSGLPVTTGSASSSLPSERKEKKSPTSNKSNGSLEKKLRKPGKKNPQSDSSSGNLGKHTSKVGKDDKLDFKPARKAPQPPSTKKPSSMFTYNFSKSTHHTLNTGDSSNDSTDSEMDEAIITNLDESSSDEGDSGIVLQRYSTTKQPDAKSIQEHTKSANSQSNLSKKPKKVSPIL